MQKKQKNDLVINKKKSLLKMSRGRFELPTRGFSVLCSNQLSYLDSSKHIINILLIYITKTFDLLCFVTDKMVIPDIARYCKAMFGKKFFLKKNI